MNNVISSLTQKLLYLTSKSHKTKNQMKKIIFSLAIMAFAYGANAQDTKISIGANIGAGTSTGMNLAYGGDVQADFGLSEALAITASAGYEGYSWKGGGSSELIPLLAGAKYQFGESNVYGHAQLGYGVSTAKGGGGAFGYAPSVGYNFSPNLDASIKYLAFTKNSYTTSSINLRVAYTF